MQKQAEQYFFYVAPKEIIYHIFIEYLKDVSSILPLISVCKKFKNDFNIMYSQSSYFDQINHTLKKNRNLIKKFNDSDLFFEFTRIFWPQEIKLHELKDIFMKATEEQKKDIILNLLSKSPGSLIKAIELDQIWILEQSFKYLDKYELFKQINLEINKPHVFKTINFFVEKIGLNEFLNLLKADNYFYLLILLKVQRYSKLRYLIDLFPENLYEEILQKNIFKIDPIGNNQKNFLKYSILLYKERFWNEPLSIKINIIADALNKLDDESFSPIMLDAIQPDKVGEEVAKGIIKKASLKTLKLIVHYGTKENFDFYLKCFTKLNELGELKKIFLEEDISFIASDKNRDIELLRELLKKEMECIEEEDIRLDIWIEVFGNLIRRGQHWQIFQKPYFKQQWEKKHHLSVESGEFFLCQAINYGCLSTVEWVFYQYTNNQSIEILQEILKGQNEDFPAFRQAVKQGNLNIFKYLYRKLDDSEKINMWETVLTSTAFGNALKMGYFGMLEYIFDQLKNDIKDYRNKIITIIMENTVRIEDGKNAYSALYIACTWKHTKFVEYFFNIIGGSERALIALQKANYEIIRSAIAMNDFETLKCLMKQLPKNRAWHFLKEIIIIYKNEKDLKATKVLACAFRSVHSTLESNLLLSSFKSVRYSLIFQWSETHLNRKNNFFNHYSMQIMIENIFKELNLFMPVGLQIYLIRFFSRSIVDLFYDLPNFNFDEWKPVVEEIFQTNSTIAPDNRVELFISILEEFFIYCGGSVNECKLKKLFPGGWDINFLDELNADTDANMEKYLNFEI